jgi:hypothetical protein
MSRFRAREFFRLAAGYAAPRLLREGAWTADYRRLRIAGRKRCLTVLGAVGRKTPQTRD